MQTLHDFSSVRVHVGAEATRAARAVAARADTLGQDIVFGQGAYAPGTAEGTRLLAHELTRVVQQRRGVALQGSTGQVGDGYERHADAVADRVVTGRPALGLLNQGPGGALFSSCPFPLKPRQTAPHAHSAPYDRATSAPPIPVGSLADASQRLPRSSRRCCVSAAQPPVHLLDV
jgi:hypothetical protein